VSTAWGSRPSRGLWGGDALLLSTALELPISIIYNALQVDTNCIAPSLIPTSNGNTVRSFSTHGRQSAAQASSTTVSRSDVRSIQHLDSSAHGLVRRWLLIGYFPIHVLPSDGISLSPSQACYLLLLRLVVLPRRGADVAEGGCLYQYLQYAAPQYLQDAASTQLPLTHMASDLFQPFWHLWVLYAHVLWQVSP
jgi:hypothetical protein